jgi:hypothetical protein
MGERLIGVDSSLTELRRSNSQDHAEVVGRLTAVEREVHGLPKRIENHASRIDSLEADRDRRAGMVQLVRFAQGLALAAVSVAAYLVGITHG